MTSIKHSVSVQLAEVDRLRLLQPPDVANGPVRMVLDTDTYNEIDDQFALVYALLARDRVSVEAVYAAPYHNSRSDGPADGMRKSYEEILRVLDRLGRDPDGFVFEGSSAWLSQPRGIAARYRGDPGMSAEGPVPSPAVDDLVGRAKAGGGPLYVVAIGAPTNVASALLAAPEIASSLVVVWLGGHPHYWSTAREFNLRQDLAASRVLLDSGVALVHVPCKNVTEHLRTTQPEIDRYVRPTGPIGAYLADIFAGYFDDHFARSKVLWDLGAVAWVVQNSATPSSLVHSPLLTSEITWSHDLGRHLIREVTTVNRDVIFADLFRLLDTHAKAGA